LYGADGLNRHSQARRLATGVFCTAAVFVGVLSASSYQGCNVYDASLLLPGDAGALSGQLDGGACVPVLPPSRPLLVNPDAETQISLIVAAFNSIDIGVAADGGVTPYGYDLDGVCTCPGPPSCAREDKAHESCDDKGGVDNNAVLLFLALGAATSTGTLRIDQGLQSGQYGLLIAISGYNQQLNDDRVQVDFYVSNGLNRTSDGGIPTPQLDGTDQWTIDPGSLSGNPGDVLKIPSCARTGQCLPLYSDDQAYVSNGFVVAKMPRPIPIAFGDRSFLGGATMSLSDARIVGELSQFQLSQGGLSYQLTGGTIAGRWPTSQLLSTLSTVGDPIIDGGFLCGDSSTYKVIKAVACGAADISQNMSNDNSVPLAVCDAVSVGMRFTAVPAVLGEVLAVPPALAGCGDGGVAFTDTCLH
jgi:hypothetical protein